MFQPSYRGAERSVTFGLPSVAENLCLVPLFEAVCEGRTASEGAAGQLSARCCCRTTYETPAITLRRTARTHQRLLIASYLHAFRPSGFGESLSQAE